MTKGALPPTGMARGAVWGCCRAFQSGKQGLYGNPCPEQGHIREFVTISTVDLRGRWQHPAAAAPWPQPGPPHQRHVPPPRADPPPRRAGSSSFPPPGFATRLCSRALRRKARGQCRCHRDMRGVSGWRHQVWAHFGQEVQSQCGRWPVVRGGWQRWRVSDHLCVQQGWGDGEPAACGRRAGRGPCCNRCWIQW